MNSITSLSPAQLRKAASIQEKIQSLQKRLSQLLGAAAESAFSEVPRKRKISAAGLASIRAAQKARWAKVKGARLVKKGKRKMSAAAKARLSKLAKERWAARKKAGKSKL